jgi:hypothetical protein
MFFVNPKSDECSSLVFLGKNSGGISTLFALTVPFVSADPGLEGWR